MRCCVVLSALLGAALPLAANAADRGLFADGFDPPEIAAQFPRTAGGYVLPPGPAADQLAWLMQELAVGQTTTVDEVNAHFASSWFGSFTPQETANFINSIRTSYPGAVITDLVGLTPIRATVVIDSPGSPPPSGFLSLGARFTGTKGISLLSVSSFSGNVQFLADRTLSLAQAADKFATLSGEPALLVGRIDGAGQCTTSVERNGSTPRATASIFKIWVMGGVAESIAANVFASADTVPLVASEIAPGGLINIEPLGTPFTVAELSRLMLGNSDNTATDLLHEEVGRPTLNALVGAYGMAAPTLLTPFLNISEQFHVFTAFDLPTAQSYVNGSEAFQAMFLADEIEPLGPQNGGPFFHPSLLTDGTWQASPMDVCAAFASLRALPPGSEALATADAALSAAAAQPNVRNAWDRVWYKGGSLASGANGLHVLTHAWMLENAGQDPYVVVAMSNSDGGGIDQFAVQSITGRMLELVAAMAAAP